MTPPPDDAEPPGDRVAPDALVLPRPVRARLAALASERLGALPPEQVPTGLRAFARFTPGKRARLAAVPLASALEVDVVFRQRVAEALRDALPDLALALDRGEALPAVPPEDVAAAAYLLRPDGWRQRVREVVADLARQQAGRDDPGPAADPHVVQRLEQELAAARAGARQAQQAWRDELAAAQAELVAVRRRMRELGDRVGRAEAAQRSVAAELEQERARLAEERAEVQQELREARARTAQADQLAAAGRQAVRDGRAADELRLRLLLDALLGAANGLRRELALAPAEGRPADALAEEYAAPTAGAELSPRQGRAGDDPGLLDALLQVPMVHLLVDGYNVTKSGYGELPLEAQRGRLLAGLGALAARTGAEVTVVFDGTERVTPAALPSPRRVRLLFSHEGETADEVLRRLVRHEPAGRPLVVVSSDKEVADGVRACGARDVPSVALLRLLARS